MNTKAFFLVLIASAAASSHLAAQGSEAPPIARPERLAWTTQVSIAGEDPASASSSQLKEIQSALNGDLKHDVFVYRDGRRQEVWYRQGLRLLSNPEGTRAYVTDPSGDQLAPGQDSFFSGDLFRATAWLAPSLFVGEEKVNGQSCALYRTADGQSSAWISQENRLPVKVQSGPVTYSFTYQSAIPSLSLSGIFEEAWQRYESLAQRRALIERKYSGGR